MAGRRPQPVTQATNPAPEMAPMPQISDSGGLLQAMQAPTFAPPRPMAPQQSTPMSMDAMGGASMTRPRPMPQQPAPMPQQPTPMPQQFGGFGGYRPQPFGGGFGGFGNPWGGGFGGGCGHGGGGAF